MSQSTEALVDRLGMGELVYLRQRLLLHALASMSEDMLQFY
jgi:hypothetical protein